MTLSVIRSAAIHFSAVQFSPIRFAAATLAMSAMLAAEVSTAAAANLGANAPGGRVATIYGRHGLVVGVGPASFQIATQRNNNNPANNNLVNNNLANGVNLFAAVPNQLRGGAMNPAGAGIPLRGSLRTFAVGPNTVFTSTHSRNMPLSAAMLRPGQLVSVTAQGDLALRVRIISGGPYVMRMPRTHSTHSRPHYVSLPGAPRSNPAAIGGNATTVHNATRSSRQTALANPMAQANQAAQARHAAQKMAAATKAHHVHPPKPPSQHHLPHMPKLGTHVHS